MRQVSGLMLDAPQENEHIVSPRSGDWRERINLSVQEWLYEQKLSLQSLSCTERRDLIVALEYKHAFHGQRRPNMWRAAWGSTVLLSTNI